MRALNSKGGGGRRGMREHAKFKHLLRLTRVTGVYGSKEANYLDYNSCSDQLRPSFIERDEDKAFGGRWGRKEQFRADQITLGCCCVLRLIYIEAIFPET